MRGRWIDIDGRRYLFFAGTSYLGLQVHEEFIGRIVEGIRRYGVHYGGSLRFPYSGEVYGEVEQFFARWCGVEAALLCSSGTTAGLLTQRWCREYELCIALEAHPAQVSCAPFHTVHMVEEEGEVVELVRRSAEDRVLVWTCSVYSSWGRKRGWAWLEALPQGRRYRIVVDDSHGIGVTGVEGRGVSSALKLDRGDVEMVWMFSLAKAFSVPGGIIAGSGSVVDSLRGTETWGGSSPPPGPYLYALVRSEGLIRRQYRKLCRLVERAEALLAGVPHRHELGYPVFWFEGEGLAEYLREREMIISSFRYPDERSELQQRVVIHAALEEEDVEKMAEAVKKFYRGCG